MSDAAYRLPLKSRRGERQFGKGFCKFCLSAGLMQRLHCRFTHTHTVHTHTSLAAWWSRVVKTAQRATRRQAPEGDLELIQVLAFQHTTSKSSQSPLRATLHRTDRHGRMVGCRERGGRKMRVKSTHIIDVQVFKASLNLQSSSG